MWWVLWRPVWTGLREVAGQPRFVAQHISGADKQGSKRNLGGSFLNSVGTSLDRYALALNGNN
jgi:hypothetical protein